LPICPVCPALHDAVDDDDEIERLIAELGLELPRAEGPEEDAGPRLDDGGDLEDWR
jgi:hypothetical protein